MIAAQVLRDESDAEGRGGPFGWPGWSRIITAAPFAMSPEDLDRIEVLAIVQLIQRRGRWSPGGRPSHGYGATQQSGFTEQSGLTSGATQQSGLAEQSGLTGGAWEQSRGGLPGA